MKRAFTVMAMVIALALSTLGFASASGTVYYDAVPDPLPSNIASLGYMATSTTELGQLVTPDSTGQLNTATVTMSSFACETGQWNLGNCESTPGSSFDHPITVNVYEVENASGTPAVGALFDTVTKTVAVPYRPSADDANCTDYTTDDGDHVEDDGKWYDGTGCFDGYAFKTTFELSGETLPSEVIVTVAYKTSRDDALDAGPYDALNVGLDLGGVQPTVGTAGDIFWATDFPDYTPELSAEDFGWVVMVSLGFEETGTAVADDCKDGGFEQFGFRNQGRCIASVKANANAGR